MTIPASYTVQVVPGVLSAAGSAVALNGLILTQSPYVPIGTVQAFASAASVGAFFGLTGPEYEAAQIYFQGPNNAQALPGTLLFAQYNPSAVAAYLRGAALTLTLAQLQAVSGTLTVSVNGTPATSSSINLTSATSFSDAASKIQAAFTSPNFAVSWDAQHNAFVLTATTTGAASTIAFATGTLAVSLALASGTGAVLSRGADAATPGTFLPGVLQVSQNWAAFTTTWEPSTADKTAFSAWTALQANRYAYVGYDSDVNAKVIGSTTTWGYAVQQAQDSGTVCIFGDLTHAAFVLGVIASINFTQPNGRITLDFQSQSGLIPSVTNVTDAQALVANGYNYYGANANASSNWNWFANGSISGQYKWIDSYVNQIWLNANLQGALVNLLLSAGSIPYNAQGYAMVDAAIQDPVNAAVAFGAIRPGVALSQSQIAQLKATIGADVSNVIYAKGWYLQIVPATAAQRIGRTSPAATLWYADGGAIQQITLSSIEVQ
ncbi:MAG TPA: DUF3383 domain-containing protein [Frateuria sp.]|uniref:DUF3383 domain-containing protein n=1 Tax=Frateuria sp. TaxID=2211372 RepID=UPI002DF3269A|nr:DUF3383 domain-containing protein [Frateuria sp.]